MSIARAWVIDANGQACELSPLDRGLAYGDGLFETMRVHGGCVPLLDRHLARLTQGLGVLGFPAGLATTLEGWIPQWVAGVDAAVLKVIITRGIGSRGYLPPVDPQPVLIISLADLPVAAESGARVCRPAITLSRNTMLAGVKHLNRLEQVLARQEVFAAGCDEGLMFDDSGHLIEAVSANVFVVIDGRVFTPPLDQCGIAGVMRAWILDWMRAARTPVIVSPLSEDDLDRANEVFLCNTLIGVRAVSAYEDQTWDEGPVCRALREALAEAQLGF